MSDRFVVLSGCSCGGKSTLLAELRRRGHAVVDEPGRRIVREEVARDGAALPWIDLAAFARRAIEVPISDREAAMRLPGWVFFDRSLVDAAATLEHAASEPALGSLGRAHRYHRVVFLTPPWPEIFHSDPERRHGFEEALAEYARLERAYLGLGYRVVIPPKTDVEARADVVMSELEGTGDGAAGKFR
jgi:predicted ATPase